LADKANQRKNRGRSGSFDGNKSGGLARSDAFRLGEFGDPGRSKPKDNEDLLFTTTEDIKEKKVT
jgi:hypothetical protein